MSDKPQIKVAILDLYNGVANQGMRGFNEILNRYKTKNNTNITWQVFNTRQDNQLPDLSFDLYISSGGPGNPLSENEEWDKNYFKLIDALEEYNAGENGSKKHMLFICHSFQLMCRRYNLGEISLRRSPSFGILPVHFVDGGATDPVFEGLADPFYAVDSRSWQVVHPNEAQFEKIGAKVLAIEKERPYVDLPRALMAIRFNEYFVGTQFHPEADPVGMMAYLVTEVKKKEVIDEHGEAKYNEMIARLEDPDKILHTQNTLIPNFLDQAILSLQEA
ncbi:type 1 glutamine amidotransferase [Mucilaginibacter ginkgonis]|uniref:GMP synthase n=1 Tax=Mucilaginibacter ginkgonis TaxID=2682091 RepID=A0A6I4HYN2_9SPHI|nr:GMP synthase [Mucilaginibacter ginkgonis]QQL49787.1 GMP synthase [Mucilaginibacter ginkgonis]